MTVLADANVLIAVTISSHVHHRSAARWLVTGHADVTDAYLAALARQHAGRLATFDRRLGRMRPDVVDLIPI